MNVFRDVIRGAVDIATEHVIKNLGNQTRERITNIKNDVIGIYEILKAMPPESREAALTFIQIRVKETRKRITKQCMQKNSKGIVLDKEGQG